MPPPSSGLLPPAPASKKRRLGESDKVNKVGRRNDKGNGEKKYRQRTLSLLGSRVVLNKGSISPNIPPKIAFQTLHELKGAKKNVTSTVDDTVPEGDGQTRKYNINIVYVCVSYV